VESDLVFGGFLVFHCPLKPDAIEMVKMIGDSSHRVCFFPKSDYIHMIQSNQPKIYSAS